MKYLDPDGERQIICDDLKGKPVVEKNKKLSDRVSLEINRDSEKVYNNDTAYLKIDNQKVEVYDGVQSEKNMRSGEQGDEERWDPDYSDPDYPNATLIAGEYTAKRTKETSRYTKALRISSEKQSLPGFSIIGIKEAWGFLVHSYSSKTKKQVTGWSLGCQVFPDAEFDRLNEHLDGFGVQYNDTIPLIIKDDQI